MPKTLWILKIKIILNSSKNKIMQPHKQDPLFNRYYYDVCIHSDCKQIIWALFVVINVIYETGTSFLVTKPGINYYLK